MRIAFHVQRIHPGRKCVNIDPVIGLHSMAAHQAAIECMYQHTPTWP